ncbi:MAG: hypothetical protein ACTSRS_04425 [Candidatus Helarchaeota archaeon]
MEIKCKACGYIWNQDSTDESLSIYYCPKCGQIGHPNTEFEIISTHHAT